MADPRQAHRQVGPITGTVRNVRSIPPGYRRGPVGLGTTHFYRFFITYRISQPVIYEYRGGSKFSPVLTYQQKNRNYYRVGDIILHNEVSSKWLKRIFPTLGRQRSGKSMMEGLIESEILGPAPDYKTAQVIWSIRPSSTPGQGIVRTKPVLYFGKTAVVLEDERGNYYNTRTLSEALVHVKLAASLSGMLPFIYAVSDIMLMVITGVGKAALSKGVSVYLVRKGAVKTATEITRKQAAKQVAGAMAKNAVKATIPATLEFTKAFLATMSTSGQEEAFRRAATARNINYRVPREAISNGSWAFAKKLVEDCMGKLVSKVARQMGVDRAANEYFANKIIQLFTTEPTGVLVTTYRKANLDRERGRVGGTGETSVVWANELKGWFAGQIKGLLKDLVTTLGGR